MPELPEVESLRLGLNKKIIGSKILNIEIVKPKLVSSNGTLRKINKKKEEEFKKEIVGEKIKQIIGYVLYFKNILERKIIAGRATVFCRHCQK